MTRLFPRNVPQSPGITVVYLVMHVLNLKKVMFSRALSWGDSTASLKVTGLMYGVMSHLVTHGRINEELASHALVSVLLGLQTHGQHDANQGSLLVLGTQLYGLLRPIAPGILHVRIPLRY